MSSTRPQNHLKERLKILDGLRFIAVGSVVLFHVFPQSLPGGYIGVDIFFLISGFIIYLKYSDKLAVRQVSFRSFFVLRIRRLLPAYFVFLTITSFLALAILPPNILKNYAEVLIANGFYLQNFVLFGQGDYFIEAQSRPLLHTWSLAIEEQFYLIFPAFILALRWFRKSELALILLLIAVSAVLAFQFSSISSRMVFFFLPFRVWEFGVGFLAAYLYRSGQLHSIARPYAELCGFIGLAMVAFAVMYFSEASPFPGPQSFLALGGAFILCVFQDRVGSRFWLPLTNSMSQHFGRISYSWYLWHWPFVSFYLIYEGRLPQGLTAFAILLLGYVAGALSYSCIEHAQWLRLLLTDGRRAVVSVGMFTLLTCAIGMLFSTTDGALFRYDAVSRPYVVAQSSDVGERCGFVRRVVNLGSSMCQRAHGNGGAPILLIGDSHSNMIRPLLTRMAGEANRSLYVTTHICRPTQTGSAFCPEGYWQRVRDDILRLGIGSVVIAAYWPFDFNSEDYSTAISHLSGLGLKTFVMQSLPEGPAFEPSSSNADRYGDVRSENEIYATENRHSYLTARTNQILAFELLSRRRDIEILRVADAVCPNQHCLFAKDGKVLYKDDDHISEQGAEILRSAFEPVFSQAQ